MSQTLFIFDILNSSKKIDQTNFSLTNTDMGLPADIPISIEQECLVGGKQVGSRLITLCIGNMTIRIVPTRAMAILDVTRNNQRFGWDSPVKEIVHPQFINQEASGGIGWLDGFNEMLVRCGYQWSGHPGQDGDEFLTLHGRIQNTPADNIVLSVEQKAPYRVTLSGSVSEKRFKFTDYEVNTSISLTLDSPYIDIVDTLTNNSSYDNTYQSIYHNNFGQPILEEGSKIHIAIAEISPFNQYATQGLDQWQSIKKPTKHFDEMVYNIRPLKNDDGTCFSLLENANKDTGVEVAWQYATLPVFTLWKNTDTVEQGYVVGLEPGTSFAYNRSHQHALGLVPTIKAKESVQFSVRFGLFTSASEVDASRNNIKQLQSTQSPVIQSSPPVNL